MVELRRRLRVRDDGTGQERDQDVSFEEFAGEAAIVLLGDPGMGKSTLFRRYAGEHYTTVRRFLNQRVAPANGPLFLDALDEYRAVSASGTALDDVAKALHQSSKPFFRLSCRAADWYGQVDEEILKDASSSGRLVVLELLPFTELQIRQLVAGIVPDVERFMDEADQAGLGPLLGNPQSLELIAVAWNGPRPPRNKFEAFDGGIEKLLRERNAHHADRSPERYRDDDLRRAAGSAAAVILLSNAVGISRTEVGDGDYLGSSQVPYRPAAHVDAAFKRRIFSSPTPDRFEFTHRTVAEFLAAEDLARRINEGLPVDRVLALMCGVDGKPISSLRGLFAWVMCHLGPSSEMYIDLDPYGVATYGDASALTPGAQARVWDSLRTLRDPWFLANEDDRGTFRGLATVGTTSTLRDVVLDEASSTHLKIAALEAVANSASDLGLSAIARDIALQPSDNTWLRTTALKAYARSAGGTSDLEMLDGDLANKSDDDWAAELRVELLGIMKPGANLASRILSILSQAASRRRDSSHFGAFHTLIDLPSIPEVEALLGSGADLLRRDGDFRFELETLFGQWLIRRLSDGASISPANLASWVSSVLSRLQHSAEDAIVPLRERFRVEPGLFEATFELLVPPPAPREENLLRFLSDRVWRLLPEQTWPVSPAEFLLARSRNETSAERAAHFFRAYLNRLTSYASVELTQAGFDRVAEDPKVASALGSWNRCDLEDWHLEQLEARETRERRHAERRVQNVTVLNSRLENIRQGIDEKALAWAVPVFLGDGVGSDRKESPRTRLVNETNEEIADALIEGLACYVSRPGFPTLDDVVEAIGGQRIPYTHIVLSVAVWLRHQAKQLIPKEAIPACIAAVIAHGRRAEATVPGYETGLKAWLDVQCHEQPSAVASALRALWISETRTKRGYLPGFAELTGTVEHHALLASIAVDVLNTDILDDVETVRQLASFLVATDRPSALAIARSKVRRRRLSPKVKAIWQAMLFVGDPDGQAQRWEALAGATDDVLWEVIDLLRSPFTRSWLQHLPARNRSRIISLLGRRFVNVPHPTSAHGSRNPWDASEFVAGQIKMLATVNDADADASMASLDLDDALGSYRDLLRHHHSQMLNRRRDASWTFPSAEEVKGALNNEAPASAADLLAYVVDHLNVLGREMRATQRERHRAYWNQDGRRLSKPKPEEDCSGLLADDLMRRIQPHGLIVEAERHMVAEKECDIVVLQSNKRLIPIEVKHHYNRELWTAWQAQLKKLYGREASAGGLGVYVVFWSGKARRVPPPPNNITRPVTAAGLRAALGSLIPADDRQHLKVVVLDISPQSEESSTNTPRPRKKRKTSSKKGRKSGR